MQTFDLLYDSHARISIQLKFVHFIKSPASHKGFPYAQLIGTQRQYKRLPWACTGGGGEWNLPPRPYSYTYIHCRCCHCGVDTRELTAFMALWEVCFICDACKHVCHVPSLQPHCETGQRKMARFFVTVCSCIGQMTLEEWTHIPHVTGSSAKALYGASLPDFAPLIWLPTWGRQGGEGSWGHTADNLTA